MIPNQSVIENCITAEELKDDILTSNETLSKGVSDAKILIISNT